MHPAICALESSKRFYWVLDVQEGSICQDEGSMYLWRIKKVWQEHKPSILEVAASKSNTVLFATNIAIVVQDWRNIKNETIFKCIINFKIVCFKIKYFVLLKILVMLNWSANRASGLKPFWGIHDQSNWALNLIYLKHVWVTKSDWRARNLWPYATMKILSFKNFR